MRRRKGLSGPIVLLSIVCVFALLAGGLGTYIGLAVFWKADVPFASVFTDVESDSPDWSLANSIAGQWDNAIYYEPVATPVPPEPSEPPAGAPEQSPVEVFAGVFTDIDTASFSNLIDQHPEYAGAELLSLNLPIGSISGLTTVQGDAVLAIYGSQRIMVVKRAADDSEMVLALDYSAKPAGLSLARQRAYWETLSEHRSHSGALVLLGANSYIYNEARAYGTVIGGITAHGVVVYRSTEDGLMVGFNAEGKMVTNWQAAGELAYNSVQGTRILAVNGEWSESGNADVEPEPVEADSEVTAAETEAAPGSAEPIPFPDIRDARGGIAVREDGTLLLLGAGTVGGGVTLAEFCEMLRSYGAYTAVQTLCGSELGMYIDGAYPLTAAYGEPQHGTLAYAAWTMGIQQDPETETAPEADEAGIAEIPLG